MKSRLLAPGLFLILLYSSCKKETQPSITGQWMNTAVYTDPASGGTGWETVNARFHEFVTFSPDASFVFFTDIPAGSGLYNYDHASRQLNLQFKEGNGASPRSEVREVEHITAEKLVVSLSLPGGQTYKTEYTRVN